MGETTWTVTRSGDRVRINVMEAEGFAEIDTEAIAQALEEYLSDDEVKVIHFNGPVLMEQGPLDGLGRALRDLGDLARSRWQTLRRRTDLIRLGSALLPASDARSIELRADRQG